MRRAGIRRRVHEGAGGPRWPASTAADSDVRNAAPGWSRQAEDVRICVEYVGVDADHLQAAIRVGSEAHAREVGSDRDSSPADRIGLDPMPPKDDAKFG